MEELPVCAIGDTQRCSELMHQHGVVVFRNVLTSEEIKTSESKFWDWAERAAPGLKRDSPETHADLGKMGWGDTGIVAKQRPASRGAAAPSRHRCDSCPSHNEVGGFFFDFEAIRTESSDRDAPRRHVVFGKVLDAVSMMVVHKIEAVQAGADNKPKLPVLISQCGEL